MPRARLPRPAPLLARQGAGRHARLPPPLPAPGGRRRRRHRRPPRARPRGRHRRARGQPLDGHAHHLLERRVGRAARCGRLLRARARPRHLQRGARGRARRARAHRRAHDRHRAPAAGPRRGRRARAARPPSWRRRPVEGDQRGFRVARLRGCPRQPASRAGSTRSPCASARASASCSCRRRWYPADVGRRLARAGRRAARRVPPARLRGGARAARRRSGGGGPARRPRRGARRRSATACRRSTRATATRRRSRRSCAPSPCPPPRRERSARGSRRARRHARGRARGRTSSSTAGASSRSPRRARPRAARRSTRGGCVVLPGAVDAHVHVGLDYRLMDGTRDDLGRQLRGRLARRGGRRHDDDHRLRDAGRGRGPARAARAAPARHRGRAPSTSRCTAGCSRPTRRRCAEIPELVARGVPSLKVFLAYSQLGEPMADEDLLAVWKAIGGGRRDHAGALRELADHPAAARGRDRRGRHGLRGLRGLAAAALRGRRRRRARSPSAAASGAETYCVHLSTLGAVQHLRLARMHGLPSTARSARTTCCWTSRSTSASAPGDFVMSPPLRTRRAPRGALGGADRRHDRGRGGRSRGLARARQGAGPGLPRGGARRGRQRPAAAAAGGAGRVGRGLRLGARRARSRPRTRRASSGCRDKGALAPGRHADLVVLHPADVAPVPQVPPYWRVDNGIFRGLPHVPPRVVLQRGRVLARARRVHRRGRGRRVHPRAQR